MTTPPATENPVLHLGDSISKTFNHIQDIIRKRAYHISLDRESSEGDSLSDWLDAQTELLTPVGLELKDQKKNLVVEGKVNGFSPDEIEIEVRDGMLRVSGSHTDSSSKTKDDRTESKSTSTHFYQSLSLPWAVDEDKIRTKLAKNGQLKVTLPKRTDKKQQVQITE